MCRCCLKHPGAPGHRALCSQLKQCDVKAVTVTCSQAHTADYSNCHHAQAEEARFRAQLQELEQQRMGMIEAAWRAREAQRQSEIAAMKAKYTGLEKQTRELLTATQERERALLAAEAELRLRKAGLEREAAARMSEAEAAVRRLQVRGRVSLCTGNGPCAPPCFELPCVPRKIQNGLVAVSLTGCSKQCV